MADAPAANWTAADVERLSAQGWRVELWKGQLLRMAPTGDLHGRVTWRLSSALDRYVEAHSLGQLWPAEAGFDLTRPDEAQQTVLAPDIAFVRAERVPPPVEGFAHVVPDLVVETASPTQSRQEMDGKAQQWLERGVPLVWVVWPARHQVDEWRQGDTSPRALGMGDHRPVHGGTPTGGAHGTRCYYSHH
jgi:Uma2 family endonuclease